MTPADAVAAPVPSAQPRALLGLPPTVVSLASTHFIVDAYTNIYSPLLPLFIPQFGLSLTAVGGGFSGATLTDTVPVAVPPRPSLSV